MKFIILLMASLFVKASSFIPKTTSIATSSKRKPIFSRHPFLKTNDEVENKPTKFHEKLFDQWYSVGFESHMSHSTDPISVTVLDVPLVLWRNAQDDNDEATWCCAIDSCPHRGVALSKGKVTSEGGLECSYHGWKFNDKGRATRIPQLGPNASIPRRACLHFRIVRIVQGVIYVWMGDGVPNHDPPLSLLPEAEKTKKVLVTEFQYDSNHNLHLIMENILDMAHVQFLHDGMMGFSRDRGEQLVFDLDESSLEGFQGKFRSISEKKWVQMSFYGPGHFQLKFPSASFKDAYISQEFHLTPISNGKTRFMFQFYFVGFPKLLSSVISIKPKWITNLSSCKLFEQDSRILRSQLQYSPRNDLFLKSSDEPILAYRRWLKKHDNALYISMPSRQQEQLSRYEGHIQHSPITKHAYENIGLAKHACILATVASLIYPTLYPHSLPSTICAKMSLGLSLITYLLFKFHDSFSTTWSQERHQKRILLPGVKKNIRSAMKCLNKWWKNGVNIHRLNLSINMRIFYMLLRSSKNGAFTPLCMVGLFNNYTGQFADHFTKIIGGKIATGRTAVLRYLSKMCLVLHGFGVPMAAFPITEIATKHGLFNSKTRSVMNFVWLAYSFAELFKWILFDSTSMTVVDKTGTPLQKHEGQQLSGTVSYSSGKVMQCLIPVFSLLFYQLSVGTTMLITRRGSFAGCLLVASAVSMTLSSSLNRPDIQIFGETFGMASSYSILAASL